LQAEKLDARRRRQAGQGRGRHGANAVAAVLGVAAPDQADLEARARIQPRAPSLGRDGVGLEVRDGAGDGVQAGLE
jgi:hypothetical protein